MVKWQEIQLITALLRYWMCAQ